MNYRANRTFTPENQSRKLERVLDALTKNLSDKPANLTTALTCPVLSSHLRETLLPDMSFCEELSLKKVVELSAKMTFPEAQLLIRELPRILRLPYADVDKVRAACLDVIPQMMNYLREKIGVCRDCIELDYLQDLLRS